MKNNKMLIDPEPLKKQIQDCIHQCYQLCIGSVGPLIMFLDYIEDAPRIEAMEVVHGQWEIEVGMNYNRERVCPVCNKHIESNCWNYCPNCGAKMDER